MVGGLIWEPEVSLITYSIPTFDWGYAENSKNKSAMRNRFRIQSDCNLNGVLQ